MTPEAARFLDKAGRCLDHARAILAIGFGEEAGRGLISPGFTPPKRLFLPEPAKPPKPIRAFNCDFFSL